MKVAICMYGYPYFYRKSFDDINKLKNIILGEYQDSTVDFYIHFWGTPENIGKMFKRTWERVREGDRVVKPRVKEWLENKYKPVEIVNNDMDLIQEDGWKESLEKVKGMIVNKEYNYYIFLPINTCFNNDIEKFKLQNGIFKRPHILPAYVSDSIEVPEEQLEYLHGIYFAKM